MKYIALLLLGIAGCSRPVKQAAVEQKAPEAIEVQVASAERRRTDRSILVTGSLLPDETVTVVSELPGKLQIIRFDFGQTVRKGEIIAEMDKTEFQLQLDRSRAALGQALARLGLDPKQVGDAPATTPAMKQAWAQMEDARFKFESARKLVASGDISKERYNEQEKAFRAREAAMEASKDEMLTQWANVQALQADVGLMEKRLRDATIRAPFDGAVSDRKAAPGQYIKENTAIVTLVKTNPLRLRLEVPESAAGVVRVGTAIEFRTDAIPESGFTATVRELNPALNEQSRTLIAEARLHSSDSRLRPGMFVQVKLTLARDVEAVVVPKRAIYTVAGLTKLFLVRDGKLVERRIPPGEAIDDWMEAPADMVRPGDQVAISNLAQLVDGQLVKAAQARR